MSSGEEAKRRPAGSASVTVIGPGSSVGPRFSTAMRYSPICPTRSSPITVFSVTSVATGSTRTTALDTSFAGFSSSAALTEATFASPSAETTVSATAACSVISTVSPTARLAPASIGVHVSRSAPDARAEAGSSASAGLPATETRALPGTYDMPRGSASTTSIGPRAMLGPSLVTSRR